jgi:hypothetical protein
LHYSCIPQISGMLPGIILRQLFSNSLAEILSERNYFHLEATSGTFAVCTVADPAEPIKPVNLPERPL